MFTKTELEMLRDAVSLRVSSAIATRAKWQRLLEKIEKLIKEAKSGTN